jgi:hypothetical protein
MDSHITEGLCPLCPKPGVHCWTECPLLRARGRAQVQHAAGEYAAALGCLLAASPSAAFEYAGSHLAEPGCPAGLRGAVLAAIGRLADADGEAAARLVRAIGLTARPWLPQCL